MSKCSLELSPIHQIRKQPQVRKPKELTKWKTAKKVTDTLTYTSICVLTMKSNDQQVRHLCITTHTPLVWFPGFFAMLEYSNAALFSGRSTPSRSLCLLKIQTFHVLQTGEENIKHRVFYALWFTPPHPTQANIICFTAPPPSVKRTWLLTASLLCCFVQYSVYYSKYHLLLCFFTQYDEFLFWKDFLASIISWSGHLLSPQISVSTTNLTVLR